MAPRKPSGETTVEVQGLGTSKALVYESGVRQVCGIPYGRLSKAWTRASLADSWENCFHDGTKLGPAAPNPPEFVAKPNKLLPVPQFSHLPNTVFRAHECLVLNITAPPVETTNTRLLPVMVYVHGGGYLYGGANRSVFDGVNLVSFSVERGTPIIVITMNYRVGIWGFLASQAIKADLAADGHTGTGNFGLTDQRLALDWVQRYVTSFGGDPNNVTLVGESAGGTSVALHLLSPKLVGFQRAIAMSGGFTTVRPLPFDEHERQYRLLCRYLSINPDAPDSLDQLRQLPEDVVTAATIPLQGQPICAYAPCEDGVIYSKRPTLDAYPSTPVWLEAYMVGDVRDEAMIFRVPKPHSYEHIGKTMSQFLSPEETARILGLYNLTPQLSDSQLEARFEDMCGDGVFKAETWTCAHASSARKTYAYHFDEPSTIDNHLKGLAYHAIDCLYLFRNLTEVMTPEQLELSDRLAGAWIDFIRGSEPWERFGEGERWMVFGGPPGSGESCAMKTEREDEERRGYTRMKQVLGMECMARFADAMDHIGWRRDMVGEGVNDKVALLLN